jgi:GNAT superfamily N-acetyltransferase
MVAAQIHGRNRRASSSKGLRWCADAGNVAARMSSRALPEIRFRRATLADVPRVVALVERAYRGEVSRKGWTTEADLLDGQRTDPAEVEGLVSGPRSHLLLATSSDDTLLGSAALTDEGDALYFGMFAVEPSLQGGGVGKAMLDRAEETARSLGRPRLRMTVIAQRAELIAWYARRGYAPTGKIATFPYGDPRFGHPKRDDLYFVILEKVILEKALP